MTGTLAIRPFVAFHARMPTVGDHGLAVSWHLRDQLVAYAADRRVTRCRLKRSAWREQLHAAFGSESAHMLIKRGGESVYVLIHPADVVVSAAEALTDQARSGWIRSSDRAHTVAPRMQDLWFDMAMAQRLELIEVCNADDLAVALEAQFPPQVEYWLEGLVAHL